MTTNRRLDNPPTWVTLGLYKKFTVITEDQEDGSLSISYIDEPDILKAIAMAEKNEDGIAIYVAPWGEALRPGGGYVLNTVAYETPDEVLVTIERTDGIH